jgi:hypothetical protein
MLLADLQEGAIIWLAVKSGNVNFSKNSSGGPEISSLFRVSLNAKPL